MRDEGAFPRQVFWTLAVAVVVGGILLFLWGRGTQEMLLAVAAGALLSTANVLLGYLTIRKTIHRSHTTFLKAVLGGMGLRMAGMLGAMAFCLAVLKLHTVAFVSTLLGLYAVYLVLEVLYLHNMVNTHRE